MGLFRCYRRPSPRLKLSTSRIKSAHLLLGPTGLLLTALITRNYEQHPSFRIASYGYPNLAWCLAIHFSTGPAGALVISIVAPSLSRIDIYATGLLYIPNGEVNYNILLDSVIRVSWMWSG
ncbi:hypothetical protein GGI42DRAFT_327252 [Trichoderma sp. SZMC 28013]